MKAKITDCELTPYLNVKGAAEAIEFYCNAFAAEERFRLQDPRDGRIGHAELSFGSSRMMISDEYPDFGALSPSAYGGSPVKLHLSVADPDSTFARAVGYGAVEVRAVKEEFYGGRSGVLLDPYGHLWHIGSFDAGNDSENVGESIDAVEMQRRWSEALE